jgi:hypothetical protein
MVSLLSCGLLTYNLSKFGKNFSISQANDNGFEIVHGRVYESHPSDRIIIFQPHSGQQMFGCIRVLRSEAPNQAEATKERKGPVWDVVRAVGSYAGLVPAGCPFEAMLVQVRFIAERQRTEPSD